MCSLGTGDQSDRLRLGWWSCFSEFDADPSVSPLCSRQQRGDTLSLVVETAHSNASRCFLINSSRPIGGWPVMFSITSSVPEKTPAA